MRVAILIYGRLNKCVEHYNNILESIGKDNIIDFFLSSDNSCESQLNNFIRLYTPVFYNNNPIEYNYDLGKYPGRKSETNIHNMICHFINKYRVFKLLEEYTNRENIKYDAVISLRIDIVLNNMFDFNNLIDNTIYIPLGYDSWYHSVNDHIAYGKLEVMRKYNYIILNIINLLDQQLTIPHPECLTTANIYYYKLQIKRVNLKYYIDK